MKLLPRQKNSNFSKNVADKKNKIISKLLRKKKRQNSWKRNQNKNQISREYPVPKKNKKKEFKLIQNRKKYYQKKIDLDRRKLQQNY